MNQIQFWETYCPKAGQNTLVHSQSSFRNDPLCPYCRKRNPNLTQDTVNSTSSSRTPSISTSWSTPARSLGHSMALIRSREPSVTSTFTNPIVHQATAMLTAFPNRQEVTKAKRGLLPSVHTELEEYNASITIYDRTVIVEDIKGFLKVTTLDINELSKPYSLP